MSDERKELAQWLRQKCFFQSHGIDCDQDSSEQMYETGPCNFCRAAALLLQEEDVVSKAYDAGLAFGRRMTTRALQEIDRLRAAMQARSDQMHPWYGICDEMMPDGGCAECEKLRVAALGLEETP